MTHSRPGHRSRRFAVILASAFILASATGCSASGDVTNSGSTEQPVTATETPTSGATAESTAADDERTCAGVGDVQTILHNVQSAFYSERMGQDELDQWAALALRILHNIPAADDGQVADALAVVQDAATEPQSLLTPSDILLSAEEGAPGAELLAACEAAGFTVVTTGFVGG